MKILAVDVGGTHVKILATGEKQKREIVSGPRMTARQMVSRVKKIAQGWAYDAVSVGFPGPVLHDRPIAEPHNLGPGWMGFDFASAFGLPVRVINDAAMQALGSYEGGKMLFLGLGTGLGSAMIVNGIVEPMELGHLPYKKGTYEDYVGNRGPRAHRQETLAQARGRRGRPSGRGTGARGRRNRRWKRHLHEEAAKRMSGRQQCPCLHRRLPYVERRT